MYWRKLNAPRIEDIAINFNGDLYACKGSLVFKSVDNGETWDTIFASGSNTSRIETAGIDTIFFGTSVGNLYVSANGGTSFQLINTCNGIIRKLKYCTVYDSSLILAGTSLGYIYLSKNLGETWNSCLISNNEVRDIKQVQNRIYAATLDMLYYSDDIGATWNPMEIVGPSDKVWSFCSDSLNNLYASVSNPYLNYIYRSTDSGSSWSLCLNQAAYKLELSPQGEIFANRFRSTDNGINWEQVFPVEVESIDFNDTTAFIVNNDHELFREESEPTGGYFFPMSVGNKWIFLYSSVSSGVFSTYYDYEIVEWEIIKDSIIGSKKYYNLNDIYYHLSRENKLYRLSYGLEMDFNLMDGETFIFNGNTATVGEGYNVQFGINRYHKSRRFVEGYPPVFTGYTRYFSDSLGCTKEESSYNGPMGTYADTDLSLVNALIYTDNSLKYYTYHKKPSINFNPLTQTTTLSVHFNFVVSHEYSRFSSNGNSRNFIKKIWIKYFYQKGDTSVLHDSLSIDVNPVSNNYQLNLMLDSLLLEGYKFNYALYVYDKSIIPEISRSPEEGYYQLVYNPVGVDDEEGNILSFSLSQNYPNPFNSSTEIIYQLANQSHVILKVYDILGREITTLVDEEKPAGMFEIEFNGASLPSGVYIYKLQAGEFTDTKKFMLMK